MRFAITYNIQLVLRLSNGIKFILTQIVETVGIFLISALVSTQLTDGSVELEQFITRHNATFLLNDFDLEHDIILFWSPDNPYYFPIWRLKGDTPVFVKAVLELLVMAFLFLMVIEVSFLPRCQMNKLIERLSSICVGPVAADMVQKLNYFGTLLVLGFLGAFVGSSQKLGKLDIACIMTGTDGKIQGVKDADEEVCYYESLELREWTVSGKYTVLDIHRNYQYMMWPLFISGILLVAVQALWIFLVRATIDLESFFILVTKHHTLVWNRIINQVYYIICGLISLFLINFVVADELLFNWVIETITRNRDVYSFYFPHVVWCRIFWPEMGSTKQSNIACLLSLNPTYEKVLAFYWIYLASLTLFNIIYMLYLATRFNVKMQISQMAGILSEPKRTTCPEFRRFVKHIGTDAVYILVQLQRQTSWPFASKIITAIVENLVETKFNMKTEIV